MVARNPLLMTVRGHPRLEQGATSGLRLVIRSDPMRPLADEVTSSAGHADSDRFGNKDRTSDLMGSSRREDDFTDTADFAQGAG